MQLLYSLAAALVAAASVATAQECTAEKALVRKEWSALSVDEHQEYIDALWCLRGVPSLLPNDQYPGVRDHLDDFVATHINYTMVIHRNAVLLSWHRHFVYLWEKALRDKCAYNGTVPYWDWSQNTYLPTNPIFDTTQVPDTSLSGDGVYNATEQLRRDPAGGLLPPGVGGGCVLSGPFKDWPTHLGPFAFSLAYPYAPLPDNAFAYNPHCLQRNLRPGVIQLYNNASIVASLLAAPTIEVFQEGLDHRIGFTGAHGGGHNAVGPTMADVFASPQDPLFMLHHGMIDRLWTTWQHSGSEGEGRLTALNGTHMLGNPAGEELVTLDTVVEFGVLDRPRAVRELMDVSAGMYCYRYDE
ncbi:tyrosinase central domain protein [Aspergillus varians]